MEKGVEEESDFTDDFWAIFNETFYPNRTKAVRANYNFGEFHSHFRLSPKTYEELIIQFTFSGRHVRVCPRCTVISLFRIILLPGTYSGYSGIGIMVNRTRILIYPKFPYSGIRSNERTLSLVNRLH